MNGRYTLNGIFRPEKRMIGGRIAHYEILDKLGEGGMGVVYKARDLHLDRLAALKVLTHDRASDPDLERMFALEAKAASALNHPHVVTIYGVEREDGESVIAMEYVAGKTLNQLIGPTGLPMGEVLQYAIQIADGLAAIHAAGIIHTDLKPRNIAVTEEGQVKILDFGLARLMRAAAGDASTAETLVSKSKIAGTTAYMSPEQAEGKPLDARTDVFAFGVIVYEMITGRHPFFRETQAATVAAILRDDPGPPEGAPPELARLVARCLQKNPERRIRHLDDAKLALEEMKAEIDEARFSPEPLPEPPAAGRPRLWWVPIALALTGVAGGVLAAWFLFGVKARVPSAAPPVPITSYLGNEVQPSFSPDGNQVAFVWDGERQDNPDIYVKLIGGSEQPLRLTSHPAQDLSPAWSPDGRFIAFLRNDNTAKASVLIVPAIGGPERLVCDLGTSLAVPAVPYMVVAPVPLLAWAPDAKSLVLADRSSRQEPFGLFVVSLQTGEKRRLTSAPDGYLGDGAPAVHPGGRAVLFTRAAGLTSSELYKLKLTEDLRPTGEPRRLTFTKSWNSNPAWMPDGDEFVFTVSNWYLGSASLWRMADSSRSSPKVLGSMGEAIAWPAVSAQQRRLVFSRSDSTQNIWRLPLRGGATAGPPEKLIASTRSEEAAQYSPDGSKIVFTSSRSGTPEVWVCERDGTNPVQLTWLGAAVTGSPHWSPDGKQIVFDSNREGRFDVYLINAAGGNPQRLTAHAGNDALASFSGDGKTIYFSSERTGRWEVWKMPAAGGDATQMTFGGGRAPLESPDGRRVYFEKSYDLWSIAVTGGEERKVLDSTGFLNFTVGRKGIYFLRDETVDPRHIIQFFNPANASTVPLFEIGHAVGTGFAVAPDNSSLLFTGIVQRNSDLMLVEHFQ